MGFMLFTIVVKSTVYSVYDSALIFVVTQSLLASLFSGGKETLSDYNFS